MASPGPLLAALVAADDVRPHRRVARGTQGDACAFYHTCMRSTTVRNPSDFVYANVFSGEEPHILGVARENICDA